MKYTGEKLTEISFPLGGIGTGCIGLGGDGRLAGQLVVWTTLLSSLSVFLASYILKLVGIF